jgi:hypothetical protein
MIRKVAVVSTLALALAAAPAAAQLPFRLGAQAGAALPSGDFADGTKMGYTVGVLAEVKPILLPVGIRGDVNYNEFGLEDEEGEDIDLDFRVLNVNANAILEMPGIGLKPYLIGGLGWYRGNFHSSEEGVEDLLPDAESAIGFNVGGGIRFGLAGFGAAVEAHYRTVNLDFGTVGGEEVGEAKIRYIPISFVLTF